MVVQLPPAFFNWFFNWFWACDFNWITDGSSLFSSGSVGTTGTDVNAATETTADTSSDSAGDSLEVTVDQPYEVTKAGEQTTLMTHHGGYLRCGWNLSRYWH
jgi:hypothetical protein